MTHEPAPTTWGLVAEFETADGLIEATKTAKAAGYNRMDGYSPYQRSVPRASGGGPSRTSFTMSTGATPPTNVQAVTSVSARRRA